MTRAPAAALRFCALILPLAGATGASGGQAQPLPHLAEYHIRAFGPGDGLLAGDARGLAQTPDGYLYIANGPGLVRYDGYAFQPVELPGFQSSFIDRIHLDRGGRLWILSAANDLAYIDDGRIHPLPAAPVPLVSFSEGREGTIWLGGTEGLIRVTPGVATPLTHFSTADGLPNDTAYGVFRLPDGQRVAVTRNRLARVETASALPGGLRFVPFGDEMIFTGAVRADAKGLWLEAIDDDVGGPFVLRYDGGFTRYAPGGEAVLDFDDFDWRTARLEWSFGSHVPFPAQAARDGSTGRRLGLSLTAHDGTRWLTVREGDEGRAHLMRKRDGRFEMIELRSHMDFRDINTLLEDREGSVWVGTDRGLFQLSEHRVFALTAKHGLAEGFTTPVLQTSDGSVWVGTWGGGVHRFASGRFIERFTTADGLPDDRIRSLYEASDGTLWVGTRSGLALIRGGKVVLSRTDGSDQVRAFAETEDGRLWIGTATRLLVRTGTRFESYREDHWWMRGIWALHTARDGALWIGSERGLFRIIGDSMTTFGTADGLRSDFVAAIHEEADGTLWFSTYEHGLYRYRMGTFAALTTREGMPHDGGVWSMLEDGRGGVWMSSDRGIIRVEHARLNAVADAVERNARPQVPLMPLVFTEAEGLPTRESNRASPAGWRLRDGRLVFNNLAGLVVIDPVRATAPPAPPNTVVQGVFTDGQAVSLHSKRTPELPAGTNRLAFDFAALSFLTPLQNRYRYRLDGYDDDWVVGGTDRRAAYTGLGPGRYTFRVQGASAGSGWSEAAAYSFTLQPHYWQAWWFRLPAAAVLTALLAAAYRFRVGRLLAMERLRLRIASDLHDDVGSSLSSIALLSEMLQGHERLDERERRQLERINRAAGETIDGLRDVIWLVDPKHDNLSDLVRRMRGVAGDMLNGTAYEFVAPDPVGSRPLDMAFMRNVFLIYKEALHNIVKHARARRVAIELAPDHGRFLLRIEDDGGGFAEDGVRAGHGLDSMRRRAQQVGGQIEIVSAPGEGTRITFTARMA